MAYIDVPIETEPVDLAEEAFGYIEQNVPGWLPADGNLESWLVMSLSQIAGELRELASLVPESIFFYFGESLLGLPPYAATQATGTTTWTAIDALGYHVEAGTLVGVSPAGASDLYAYEVVEAFDIPGGSTVQANVEIRALEAGSAGSGIAGTVEMLDALDFIESVVLVGSTGGGTDAETIEHYLTRLSNLLTLLSPRPILPQDFAVLVQQSIPAIARATAIDLYNPTTGDTNCPRCVTVAVVGADGNPVPAQVKADADALLQAEREVNFLAFVIDPTYTAVFVTYSVRCYPGYVASDVDARVESSLAAFLSPANWGIPPYGDPGARSWINDNTVRYLEVAEAINRTDGVHYIESLTIGLSAGAMGTADLVLPGVAPLPTPGTIQGDALPAA